MENFADLTRLPESLAILEKAAARGEGYAYWKLALWYMDGLHAELDYVKAAAYLEQAAARGVSMAPRALLRLMEQGCIPENQDRRLHYLSLGANLGDGETQKMLGLYLAHKAGGHRARLDEARHWLQLAEWNGNLEAKAIRAYMDAMGVSPTVSAGESKINLEHAALHGTADAARAVILFCCYTGAGSAPDESQRQFLWDLSGIGDAEALCDLFDFVRLQRMNAEDLPAGFLQRLFSLAKSLHPRAMFLYGDRCAELASQDPVHEEAAFRWLSRAAEHGWTIAALREADLLARRQSPGDYERAWSLLQNCRSQGLVTAVRELEAFLAHKLFERTAERGAMLRSIREHAHHSSEYAYFLARHYSGHADRARDEDYVRFWLLAGVWDGDSHCAFIMGKELQNGCFAEGKNIPLALVYYQYAAIHGHSYACAMLGDHFFGLLDGVTKNLSKALAYYERGASEGYGYCMDKLAYCHANGIGTPMNLAMAELWQKKLSPGDGDRQDLPELEAQPAARNEGLRTEAKILLFPSRFPDKAIG